MITETKETTEVEDEKKPKRTFFDVTDAVKEYVRKNNGTPIGVVVAVPRRINGDQLVTFGYSLFTAAGKMSKVQRKEALRKTYDIAYGRAIKQFTRGNTGHDLPLNENLRRSLKKIEERALHQFSNYRPIMIV